MSEKAEALRELVKDKAAWKRALVSITETVRNSFREERQRRRVVLLHEVPTDAEIKRRTNICYDWFCTLRADCHYSTERALDTLPKALRATLDGADWEPPAPIRGWAPQEAR